MNLQKEVIPVAGGKPGYHKEGICLLLERLLPKDLTHLSDSLPIVKWEEMGDAFSISLLCKQRPNASSFFYDMVTRWLIQEKRLHAEVFFSADFNMPEISPHTLSIAEIIVRFKTTQEIEEARKNIRSMDTEIRLGVVSSYHANRILEFKGLPAEGKIAMIQEKIGSLIRSRSKDFDKNIFSQMQKFLVSCVDEFKSLRDYHHISRIISVLYLIRKNLMQKTKAFPNRRHLMLKFVKTRLVFPGHEKNVLGLLIGLNFLRETELFEKTHLINALKSHLPKAKPVENSFILERSRENNIQTLYMEIEKEEGEDFTHEEIQILRGSLPEQLKGHIEHLMHPIFMPRNEEEILRNIMVLSRQLRYVNDIPQVIISFDEQGHKELGFTVIALRVLRTEGKGIEELVKSFGGKAKIVVDRVKKVGTLRGKYAKEASVLRVLLPLEEYFRPDQSVDLYRARKETAHFLAHMLGEIRDYNGGMIYHQNEHFTALKASLGKLLFAHEALLEKFFYAITPAHMRSVLDVEILKTFFLMLLQLFRKEREFLKKSDFLFKEDAKGVYVVFPVTDSLLKNRVEIEMEKRKVPSHTLISFSLDVQDFPCMGYLFLTDDKEKQQEFLRSFTLDL